MNPQNEFEKMDESMLKAFQSLRGQKFSKEEMEDFHARVMKQIADRPAPQTGFPYAGFAAAAGLSLAVILGAAVYFYQLKVPRYQEIPVKAEVVRKISIPEISAPQVSLPLPPAEIPLIPAVLNTVPAEEPPPAVLREEAAASEEDLLAEIEALKELGIWTEEDEEEAGIPVEAAFLELAQYAGDFQAPSAPVSPSSRT